MLMKGKYPVGMSMPEGELAAWRAATGREKPTTVAVVTTLVVGNCTMTLYGTDLPKKVNLKVLAQKRYKPRSPWYRKPAIGVAATSKPWVETPVVPIGRPTVEHLEAVAA